MRSLSFQLILVSCILCISTHISLSEPQYQTMKGENRKIEAIKEVFTESIEGSDRLRTDSNGNYYILNTKDSSILKYDHSFKFSKRIGSFGQGPDDLNSPSDFTIDRNGNLIIADTDNNRIQIMNVEGKTIRTLKVTKPYSVDVLSTGEIVAVINQDPNLISIFSAEGEFLRSIGEKAETGVEESFKEFHLFLNKGRLLVDPMDNIYWVSSHLLPPTIRKYSRDGILLLEFHPAGIALEPLIDRAKAKLQKSIETRQVSASGILNGVQVDKETGDMWVLPSAPLLQVYDTNGNLTHELHLVNDNVPIGGWGILILNRNEFIISNRTLGCFLLQRSGEKLNRRNSKSRKNGL